MTRQLLLLSALVATLSFACTSVEKTPAATPAQAQATSGGGNRAPASHSWGGYHWARTAPQFTLKLGDNLTSANWKSLLAAASADWNDPQAFGATSTPVLTTVVAGQSTKQCRMVPGTTQVCNSKYGQNGWLGLASINITGGTHITQGSAKMNDTYFSMAKYNNDNERRHVICQEIAHTYGLGHQSEDGSSQNSCMDYYSNTGANATSTVSTRPNAHDFDELAGIYAHADTSSTVAPFVAGAAAGSEVTEDPKSWGRYMSEISKGRAAYYERLERNGSRTLTHVYWTEEAGGRCENCDPREHAE